MTIGEEAWNPLPASAWRVPGPLDVAACSPPVRRPQASVRLQPAPPPTSDPGTRDGRGAARGRPRAPELRV